MTQVLPKWEMKAYAKLWNKYKSKGFYHEDVCRLLKQKKEVVSVLLSDLKKSDWLSVSLDPNDSRKRIYKLKSPGDAVKEMVK